MVNRKVVVAATVVLWVMTASTLFVDLPGRNTDDVIYVLALASTMVCTARSGAGKDSTRAIWSAAYAKGIHDTLTKQQRRPVFGPNDSGPQPVRHLGRAG